MQSKTKFPTEAEVQQMFDRSAEDNFKLFAGSTTIAVLGLIVAIVALVY